MKIIYCLLFLFFPALSFAQVSRADVSADISYARGLGYLNPNAGIRLNAFTGEDSLAIQADFKYDFLARKYFGDGQAIEGSLLVKKYLSNHWYAAGGATLGHQFTSQFGKTGGGVLFGGGYNVNEKDSLTVTFQPTDFTQNHLKALRFDYEFIRLMNSKTYMVFRPRLQWVFFEQVPFGTLRGVRYGISIGIGKFK